MTTQPEQPRPGDQPLPTPSTGTGMHDLVIDDLRAFSARIPLTSDAALIDLLAYRRDIGLQRYGQPLQAHNGRDALRDAQEEVADAIVYVRQLRVERADSSRLEGVEHLLVRAARALLCGNDRPTSKGQPR